MTNADCIRHMSDEQLYEFLSEWECGDIDYSITFCDLCKQDGNELNLDCDGCRKHWLQRDAVEYGGLMYWKKNTTFQTETQNSNLTFEKEDEPNCSEKPNNCKAQMDYDKGLQLFADILFDKEKIEQFLKECKAMGIEPQTERSNKK